MSADLPEAETSRLLVRAAEFKQALAALTPGDEGGTWLLQNAVTGGA
jgi:hypothetical protein